MSLENLIEKRKKWVKSSQENNFDFDSILAGLYNDPSHFIYEILQNAEDAAAKTVRFELFEDKLDIYHDGRDFDFSDIEGVTGIGISTKKGDLTAIGKFGVGFKSVFAITETPYIFSGEYRIRIEDFVVPVEMKTRDSVQRTLIRLPFNHKFRSREMIYDLVCRKLENIGLKTLLFLKNIEEIKWSSPKGSGHYIKETKELDGAKRVTVISEKESEEFIVIERPIEIDEKFLKVEVAYKLGKDKHGKELLVQEADSKLVVYFPTEKVTYLHFLIQGPYKTTPDRGDIPLHDEQNKMIIQETGKLVAESLSVIKRLGYLDSNFLNLMPISAEHKEKEPIYAVLYDRIKERLLSDDEFLPTNRIGIFSKTRDAILADGSELAEFLTKDDIEYLFSKANWLDTNITDAQARELRNYLKKELEIPEVNFEAFARKLTKEFLEQKSDEWMIDFYSHLLRQPALWRDKSSGYRAGILRSKPIIRLDNDEHVEPFNEEGKAQVYLPSETRSKYRTVKRTLTENDNALKFLKELSLTKPDLFAEVKEFILPKYKNGFVTKDEGYIEDFEKLLTAYENVPSGKKPEFIAQLSNTPFIDSINYITHERILRKPSEVYLNDPELRKYFHGINTICFVSDELHESFNERGLVPFLLEIGVEESPRRIEFDANLAWEEKSKLRGQSGHTRDNYQKDYEYEGLNIVQQITFENSLLLWRLLLRNLEALSSWQAKDFFKGKYSWYYNRRDHSESFDVKFLKILKQNKWLVDKNGKFSIPSDITISELSDKYLMESPNIDVLIKELAFKPEVIDQLPEEDKKKYHLTKKYSSKDLEKILAEHETKSVKKEKITDNKEDSGWNPEHDPDEVETDIEELTIEKIVTSDLKGQTDKLEAQIGSKDENRNENHEEEEVTEKPTNVDRKKIGTWGEECVLNSLRKDIAQACTAFSETEFGFKATNANAEEIEIVWLNKSRDQGKGCDFVRKKNGKEIEYIEVKTKLQNVEELIEITGTQWEFARKLFDAGEGDKYSIYVVLNAGQAKTKIKKLNNPIKLWKEGCLYAHPVKFKL